MTNDLTDCFTDEETVGGVENPDRPALVDTGGLGAGCGVGPRLSEVERSGFRTCHSVSSGATDDHIDLTHGRQIHGTTNRTTGRLCNGGRGVRAGLVGRSEHGRRDIHRFGTRRCGRCVSEGTTFSGNVERTGMAGVGGLFDKVGTNVRSVVDECRGHGTLGGAVNTVETSTPGMSSEVVQSTKISCSRFVVHGHEGLKKGRSYQWAFVLLLLSGGLVLLAWVS